MPNQTYQIPYSKSTLEFTLPPGIQATVAVSQPTKLLQDVSEVIQETLSHLIGKQPLRKMTNPGDRACIVFTDITRAIPDHQLVPTLLRKLEIAGVRDKDITPGVCPSCCIVLWSKRIFWLLPVSLNRINIPVSQDEALELAAWKLGPDCDVLIVSHAMLTLPVL